MGLTLTFSRIMVSQSKWSDVYLLALIMNAL